MKLQHLQSCSIVVKQKGHSTDFVNLLIYFFDLVRREISKCSGDNKLNVLKIIKVLRSSILYCQGWVKLIRFSFLFLPRNSATP